MSEPTNPPLVTVAIPLFRSERFLASIIENLDNLRYPNLEILISDRHCEDDAIDLLQAHYGTDSRFRFFAETDQLDWVTHFNFLLKQGRGTYFRWMPHDDHFPRCNIEVMVDVLEGHPDVVLVFGPTRAVDLDGNSLWCQEYPGPATLEPWGFDIPVLFNFANYCNGAFKGLFRKCAVDENDLLIRPAFALQYSERCWLFAMSLVGRFHYLRDYDYWKAIYSESANAQWQPIIRNIFSQYWVMQGYLWKLENSWRRRLVGALFMLPLTLRSVVIAALSKRTASSRNPVPVISTTAAEMLRTWILKLTG